MTKQELESKIKLNPAFEDFYREHVGAFQKAGGYEINERLNEENNSLEFVIKKTDENQGKGFFEKVEMVLMYNDNLRMISKTATVNNGMPVVHSDEVDVNVNIHGVCADQNGEMYKYINTATSEKRSTKAIYNIEGILEVSTNKQVELDINQNNYLVPRTKTEPYETVEYEYAFSKNPQAPSMYYMNDNGRNIIEITSDNPLASFRSNSGYAQYIDNNLVFTEEAKNELSENGLSATPEGLMQLSQLKEQNKGFSK